MNVSAHVDVVMASTHDTSPLAAEAEVAPAAAVEPESAEHDHKPVQHRDGKQPWCKTCGLTSTGQEPASH